MKRAKIMLMTIAVLATVGTALAFKVNKKGSGTYCYLLTTIAPATTAGACPNEIFAAAAESGTTAYYYTTLTATDCAHQANCINQAKDFAD